MTQLLNSKRFDLNVGLVSEQTIVKQMMLNQETISDTR